MNIPLFFQATSKLILGILIIALLLFISAGSFNYWNAWILIALLFVPILILGIIMSIKSPDLLKRRLEAKEKASSQKLVVSLSGLIFTIGFIVAGLDYRFNWTVLPNFVVIFSSIVFIISYILYAEALRENRFLSRTIEIQENQEVVDTGLYGIIRHPMYTSTIFLFLSVPLILGSAFSFIIFLAYPFLIIKRIKYEEELLEKELNGYSEYKIRVKYRLIPFVW